MNRQAAQILQLGLFFAGGVIFLDLLLTQLPDLDWLVLSLVFLLAAVAILGSVTSVVPRQTGRSISLQQRENEFQRLANVVNAAVYGHDKGSLRVLSEHVKALALGALAARTRLSKKEILELAENDKQSLQAIVQDEEMMRYLAGYQAHDEAPSEKKFEEMLSKIEGWSL
jgi:membrane protein implicated in regulation of membrane protease activity